MNIGTGPVAGFPVGDPNPNDRENTSNFRKESWLMNLNTVLQKAWQMLWYYRALWLCGAILALVGASTITPYPGIQRQDYNQWTQIKLSETTTLRVPGADMTIDLTAPGGIRLITPDGASWSEFRQLVDVLNREASIDLWPILIELAMILVVSLLLGLAARYVAETALIRMVDEAEETGRRLSTWEGLRRGFSFRAWRLFLLDLAIGVLAAVAFIVVFGLAVAPVLLAIGSHEAIIITAGMSTFGLLILGIYLWLVAGTLLSLFLQPVRRACVLEDKKLLASIRTGFAITRRHLKEAGLVWLIWLGLRVLWIPIGALIIVFLVPVLLLTILAGLALGGIPAALVAAVAGQITSGTTAWILGSLAGLPIFIVVMISPILFVNGLFEIYLSSIWTLAYRELRTMEGAVPEPAPQAPLVPAAGAAD
jgi:hypothetical protein